jgi:hypothetical protein
MKKGRVSADFSKYSTLYGKELFALVSVQKIREMDTKRVD